MNRERISDARLLEYLSGRAEPAERERLEQALAADPHARGRLEELRRTWEALGRWTVDVSGRDVLAGVRAKLQRPEPRVLSWRTIRRAAAMWLAAVTVGVAAGQMLLPAGGAGEPPATEREVVRNLQLDQLKNDKASEAILAVLEGEATGEGEGWR